MIKDLATGRFTTRDITNERFGRLTALEVVGTKKGVGQKWLCLCDCGNTKITFAKYLTRNAVRSCGCLAQETRDNNISKQAERSRVHGMTDTPTWKSWRSMKRRCEEPGHQAYPSYGGRGISICPEWSESFVAFYSDMGDRPPGKTLDRIDPDGNYEPGNVRWATPREQRMNQRGMKKAA